MCSVLKRKLTERVNVITQTVYQANNKDINVCPYLNKKAKHNRIIETIPLPTIVTQVVIR